MKIALMILLVLSSVAPVAAQETPRQGGILKAAMIGEPPTLDTHTTTATIAYQIAWHIFETLYTYDKQYQPVPFLAEGRAVFYDDVGRIKMGDFFTMYATRDLKGFQGGAFMHFWDAWLAR